MKNGSVNWHNPKTASFLTARNWWIVKKKAKKGVFADTRFRRCTKNLNIS
jgi:hypothetical protein